MIKKIVGIVAIALSLVTTWLLLSQKPTPAPAPQGKTLNIYVEPHALLSLNQLALVHTDRNFLDLFTLPLRETRFASEQLVEQVDHQDFKTIRIKFRQGFKTPAGVELTAETYLQGLRSHLLASKEKYISAMDFYNSLEIEEFLAGKESRGFRQIDPQTIEFAFTSPRKDFYDSLHLIRHAFNSTKNYNSQGWANDKSFDAISAWNIKDFGTDKIVLTRNTDTFKKSDYSSVVIHRLKTDASLSDVKPDPSTIIYISNSQKLPDGFKMKAATQLAAFYLSLDCASNTWKDKQSRLTFWHALNAHLGFKEPISRSVFLPLSQLPPASPSAKLPSPLRLAVESTWRDADKADLERRIKDAAQQLQIEIKLDYLDPRLSAGKVRQLSQNYDGMITKKFHPLELHASGRKTFFCSEKLGVNFSVSDDCLVDAHFATGENFQKLLNKDQCIQHIGQNRSEFWGTDDLPGATEAVDNRYFMKVLSGVYAQ